MYGFTTTLMCITFEQALFRSDPALQAAPARAV